MRGLCGSKDSGGGLWIEIPDSENWECARGGAGGRRVSGEVEWDSDSISRSKVTVGGSLRASEKSRESDIFVWVVEESWSVSLPPDCCPISGDVRSGEVLAREFGRLLVIYSKPATQS